MKKKKLDILYEDKFIIIVNKPSNLLTVATDREKDRTLYSYVYDYLKKTKLIFVFFLHIYLLYTYFLIENGVEYEKK